MKFGSFEIQSRFDIDGGGYDALATDAEGKDVRLWVGASGRSGGQDGAGPDALRAALARVYHSSLPRVLASDVIDDRAVLVLQVYRGQTLAEHLDSLAEPEETRAVLDRTRTVAAGLMKAHRAEVVHGALDAGSLFLADDGRLLLLHAGFGPFLDARTSRAPAALAPAAGDVFGLSRILVRSLSGEDPVGEGGPDRMQPHPPESFPADLPEGLRRLLARAMDPDPARGLHRAEELTGDLAVIRSSWASLAQEEPKPAVPVALVARWGLVVAVLAGLGVLLIVGIRSCGT